MWNDLINKVKIQKSQKLCVQLTRDNLRQIMKQSESIAR